ncbi:MAG: hypothetical protein HOP37_05945 [Cyclobacteriaceae bacterium]|nr:hypothetical protein [Cyclobacteriaceae bacterium]
MFFKLFFKHLSESKKLNYVREHGVMIGTRMRDERKIFLYMIKDFFVEVVYKDDNMDEAAERLGMFNSLSGLNSYLEREFKAAF